MTVARRQILLGGASLAVAALTGWPAHGGALSPALPRGFGAPGCDAWVLHDASAAAQAFVGSLRASALQTRVAEYAVSLLTREGFTAAGSWLDRAYGAALLAVLDDAEAVVVESLLKARNAAGLVRGRYGRKVLLGARL